MVQVHGDMYDEIWPALAGTGLRVERRGRLALSPAGGLRTYFPAVQFGLGKSGLELTGGWVR